MESTGVNWEALDNLVIEFAKSENLISSSEDSVSEFNSSRLVVIRKIRQFLEMGDVDSAVDLLRIHAPFVLDDDRLLFHLQKQKFVELLRSSSESRDSAIYCLRTSLAPCALDAYPEAYEEFKHVLLAFIYDKDDHTSPVAYEWSERRRFDIAGLISSVLRAHLHAYDPLFSMTLRYLISIHKGFCLRQGILSPISDLNETLLHEERDPPATPKESLLEAPPFEEVDIQALAHAVELTRQGAVDSLKFAKGDLFQAFQNELCRMKLDFPLLDELVREYCIYRGIVGSGFASPSGRQAHSEPLKHHQEEAECCSSISDADTDGSVEFNAENIFTQGNGVELRNPFEPSNHHDDCSTSGNQQPESLKSVQSKSYIIGERSRRKRWRGRHDIIGSACENDVKGLEDKYEMVLAMKELASKGMAAEVVEEINNMDRQFFVQNPILLFQLKQVEFLKLVSSGDHTGALRVACSHLGPLASSDQSLLKPLKETLLAFLLPNEDALKKGLPLHALASSLQVALGRRLGIEEPQLMKIMRATLHTHNEWFKIQMCRDRFEALLRIDFLKDMNSPVMINTASKSNTDSCTQGSSNSKTAEDSSSPAPVSSMDSVCDENAILKVMEFLALPRADAIHLLGQYNGNAETVIQQIFT